MAGGIPEFEVERLSVWTITGLDCLKTKPNTLIVSPHNFYRNHKSSHTYQPHDEITQ